MTDPGGLERRYRRLLACYPRAFRREHTEEMLAVLMAGAAPGRRRPGLAESADLIRSAAGMRLKPAGPGQSNRPWTDALAVFSVVAPLFLLAADLLDLALPYHLPLAYRLGPDPQIQFFARYGHQWDGLWLIHLTGFATAVCCQVIVAALVLLRLRRMALAAAVGSVLYWSVAISGYPALLEVIAASVGILETAALIASPGPRRGRHLLNWRHGIVLLLAAAAVHASEIIYRLTNPIWLGTRAQPGPVPWTALVVAVAFAAAAALAAALLVDRYLLALLAAMFCPFAILLVSIADGSSSQLFTRPVPLGHLALFCIPPLLLAGGAVLTAVTPLRFRVVLSSGPDQPRPAIGRARFRD
jgi:hypothetical protein